MSKFSSEAIQLAQQTQNKYGVPASVTLAQYALESGYGTSYLAKTKNNYFGMRNGSEGFQTFDSMAESFDAHGKLLAGSRYAPKTVGVTNAREYVEAIADTYAPPSDGNEGYVDKIMSIIDSNNLTQYDSGAYSPVTEEEKPSGIAGTIVEIGEDILSATIKGVAVIGVCVLAVVFFMGAFDLHIPKMKGGGSAD